MLSPTWTVSSAMSGTYSETSLNIQHHGGHSVCTYRMMNALLLVVFFAQFNIHWVFHARANNDQKWTWASSDTPSRYCPRLNNSSVWCSAPLGLLKRVSPPRAHHILATAVKMMQMSAQKFVKVQKHRYTPRVQLPLKTLHSKSISKSQADDIIK